VFTIHCDCAIFAWMQVESDTQDVQCELRRGSDQTGIFVPERSAWVPANLHPRRGSSRPRNGWPQTLKEMAHAADPVPLNCHVEIAQGTEEYSATDIGALLVVIGKKLQWRVHRKKTQ
jgi:hypothetical protein